MFFNYSRKSLVVSRKWRGIFFSLFILCASAIFFAFDSLTSNTRLMTYDLQITATYNLLCKIPFEGGAFTTDNLQNVYVYRGNSIKKYDSHGKMLFNYSDKSYGAISSVDANDPLKILVFYKDFPEVVLLDNTLSVNGNPFSPADAGFPLTTLACTSHENGVWLYDAQNFQLIRLDVNLTITQKTGNLAQAIGVPLNPNYLMEYKNLVYLNDSAQGILVFDSYGTYYKTIPITGLINFQVRGDDLFYTAKNHVHAFHLKTIMEDAPQAPDTLAGEVRIEKNLLFEKYRDSVRVFDIR